MLKTLSFGCNQINSLASTEKTQLQLKEVPLGPADVKKVGEL